MQEQARLVEVDWGAETHGAYSVNLEVLAYDRQGLLRDITVVAANEGVNVTAMNTVTNKIELTATVKLTVSVNSIEQLVAAMDKLRAQRNVVSVERIG